MIMTINDDVCDANNDLDDVDVDDVTRFKTKAT